jgi:carbonic anhydrase
MKKMVFCISALLAGALYVASATANAPAPSVTAAEALNKLMEGNKRFLSNNMEGDQHCDLVTREKLVSGQAPFAIILTCSDSRVAPELVFDEGLGDIFVVRVAGNVADPIIIGSVEYASEHLGTPLIMVMGHEKCGAVKATVDSKGKAEGNIGSIVKAIAPALKKVQADKKSASLDKGQFVESVADANIEKVSSDLTRNSPVLSKLVKEGKVKIVTAKYHLDNGQVEIKQGLK